MGGVTMFFSFTTVIPPALADGVVVQGEAQNAGQTIPAGALVINTASDEFVFGGMGATILFTQPEKNGVNVGLLNVEEGRYDEGGRWVHIRWLNGDQTNQGRQVMLDAGRFSIQRVKLYRY